ncbi:MAG: hypothetical protein E6L03_02400 [Thaumarchaeota archaeon]|nr:MAG: hypothetical protein E6L03_02400 [Nitrososphaerota archaeon]
MTLNILRLMKGYFSYVTNVSGTVTCLNKIYLQETFGTNNRCPVCKQDRLSSFPVTLNDSFSYSFSKRREPELALGIKK